MTQQGEEEYLTLDETAAHLGVNPRTVERYVKEKRLTKYRRGVGRESFFKRSEVEDLLRIRPEEDTQSK